MIYYKAREVNHPPYLVFDFLDEREIKELNLSSIDDIVNVKGVIEVNKIPDHYYGVSELILDSDGNLIPRPESFWTDEIKNNYVDVLLQRKYKIIDAESKNEFDKGFIFDNTIFSLSSNAQINWQAISLSSFMNTYTDIYISTMNGGQYLLTFNKSNDFIKVYSTTVKDILEINRNKKNIAKNSFIETDFRIKNKHIYQNLNNEIQKNIDELKKQIKQ